MALSLQTTGKREEDQANGQVDVQLFSNSVAAASSDDNYTCKCIVAKCCSMLLI